MSLTSWLQLLQLSGGNRSKRGRCSDTSKRRSSVRPTVEALEDRTVPSVFGYQTPFPTGSSPYSVAVGDFNRDGKLDLAVANYGSGTVSVMLGNGAGGFGPAVTVAQNATPYALTVGDFNRDGNPDLAFVNFMSGTVSVLLGNGAGGFGAATSYAVGSNPIALAVGDFNRDGSPDLAVANYGSNTVTVLLGNGFGWFGAQTSYAVGSSPYSVAVGDFNGDGNSDLAVANNGSNTVSVQLGNGFGGFGSATSVSVGSSPTAVAAGDLNGDGIADLVVTTNNGFVSVVRGNTAANFKVYASYSTGSTSYSVVVGDFNRDGFPDIAVANTFNGSVSVLKNTPGADFFPIVAAPVVGSYPYSLAVGDFNGDGALDLVTPNANSNTVSVLLNQLPLTTTAVSSNLTAARFGQLVTFTATVNHDPNTGTPTGVVVFKDGTTILGTSTLNSAGQTILNTPALAIGYHAITATYQGDPNFTTSTSATLNQLVNEADTTTTLTCSACPSTSGQPVTFTATVTAAAPGSGIPTGTVMFLDGTTVMGTVQLVGGSATLTIASLAQGSHSFTAVYAGDNYFTGSTSLFSGWYVYAPTPTLTSLSPNSVPEGSAAFILTLNGTNFLPNPSVTWNSTPLTVVALTSTQIQVLVPAPLLTAEGTAQVTVANIFSAGGALLPQTFTIANAPLAVMGRDLLVTGNKAFSGVVASFTDPNLNNPASEYTAIITWDDGTSRYGTITGSAGSFTVTGSHTFGAFSNLHTITVTIRDRRGNSTTIVDNLIDPPAPKKHHPAGKSRKPANNESTISLHH